MWGISDFIASAALVFTVFNLFFSYRLNKKNHAISQKQIKQSSLQEFRSLLSHLMLHLSHSESLLMQEKWHHQELKKYLDQAPLEYKDLEDTKDFFRQVEESEIVSKNSELDFDETKKVVEGLWSVKEPKQETWGVVQKMISDYESRNLKRDVLIKEMKEILIVFKDNV